MRRWLASCQRRCDASGAAGEINVYADINVCRDRAFQPGGLFAGTRIGAFEGTDGARWIRRRSRLRDTSAALQAGIEVFVRGRCLLRIEALNFAARGGEALAVEARPNLCMATGFRATISSL